MIVDEGLNLVFFFFLHVFNIIIILQFHMYNIYCVYKIVLKGHQIN